MSIKFGMFSDLHYSLPHAETRGNSARTFEDLKQGMAHFAAAGAEFTVSMGDNTQPAGDVQEQYDQLKTMVRQWSTYGMPVHATLGNHEFSQLSLAQVLEIFQTDRTYYSFDIGDIRFGILDAAYTPEGVHYSADNFDWRFGAIPDHQMAWLENILKDGKRTFLFTHNNLYYDPTAEYSDWYQVTNHDAVCDILVKAGCVEAVFQGHHHTFHNVIHRGIRFVNIPSPERSPSYTDTDFPIVEILDNGFLYNGERLQ